MQLLTWQLTRRDIERMHQAGSISKADWLGYKHIWRWVTPRFDCVDGLHHEAFVMRYGQNAYQRRINTVRQAIGLPPLF